MHILLQSPLQWKLSFEAGKNFESIDAIDTIGTISSGERMVQPIRSVVDINKIHYQTSNNPKIGYSNMAYKTLYEQKIAYIHAFF